jgi:5-methylcytosine-specific restriction endonuclease McrA
MKNCKKCSEEFKPKKGLINYCSLGCRNSRNWDEDDKKKKSISAKKSEKVEIANKNKSKYSYIRAGETKKINHKKKILESKYEDLKFNNLRNRIIYEQDGECNSCKLKKWMNNPITLELEHKDGNRNNNERPNLEMLCPNCHSLTDTWRGRNKTNKRSKISDEKLLESLLINEWNVRQALLNVGLVAKGGNYKRCYRLKKEFNIS